MHGVCTQVYDIHLKMLDLNVNALIQMRLLLMFFFSYVFPAHSYLKFRCKTK